MNEGINEGIDGWTGERSQLKLSDNEEEIVVLIKCARKTSDQ